MNIAASLLTGLALTLVTGQAVSAQTVPTVDGKYSFQSITQCEAMVNFVETSSGPVVVVKSAVVDSNGGLTTTGANVARWPSGASLELNRTGLISIGTGYITFSPGGQAAVSGGATFEGGSLRVTTTINTTVNTKGLAMHQTNQNGSSSYKITATTFTVEGQLFHMTFGNVVAGIAHTLNMVRTTNSHGNPNCLKSLTLTRQ